MDDGWAATACTCMAWLGWTRAAACQHKPNHTVILAAEQGGDSLTDHHWQFHVLPLLTDCLLSARPSVRARVNELEGREADDEPWQERGEPAGRSHGLLMSSSSSSSWGRRRRRSLWQWRGLAFHDDPERMSPDRGARCPVFDSGHLYWIELNGSMAG